MKIKLVIIFAVSIIFSISLISSLYIFDDNKASFGKIVTIKEIQIPEISPGKDDILNITLKNIGKDHVSDVNIELNLPSEFQFYQDVNNIKIPKIKSGEEKKISYRIIANSNSKEGIYKANITLEYTSHFGVNAINVGQKQKDILDIGLIIKSEPNFYVILEDSEIYKKNKIGGVILKFVNNGTADIKFLNVNLKNSQEYDIISDSNYYVGNLDSNDFQSVIFRLKIKEEYDEIMLPLKVNYKDSFNKDYEKNINVKLRIMSASELGKIKGNNIYYYITAIIIVLIIIIFLIYMKNFKRR
ncbi:MAG: hypothetical protein QXW97_00400 [Candidatus Pacearchaeota archaeon]